MSRSRTVALLLGLLSALFAVLALWLMLHNPKVTGPSSGDYTCSATYDTVLNDADNVPGGEPPSDGKVIEAQCIETSESRFTQGLVSAGAAAVLTVFASGIAVRARRGAPSRENAPVNA